VEVLERVVAVADNPLHQEGRQDQLSLDKSSSLRNLVLEVLSLLVLPWEPEELSGI
jgi:hypothetical protein